MLTTVIKVNGLYYAGELPECYKSSFSGAGFTHDFKGSEVQKLNLVEDQENAKLLEGVTNLKSVLERIFQRIRDKVIPLHGIEIIPVQPKED